jgi:peptide/nickel transport system substrate-binding protein
MTRKVSYLLLSCAIAFILLTSCAPTALTITPPTTTPTATPTVTSPPIELPTRGGTFNLAVGLDPSHLDPYYDSSMASNPVQKFYLEDLGKLDWTADRTEFDFAGYPPPKYRKGNLVESWETPDPLTIILKVRQGIRWQDKPPVNGRELTASDVEYTFHRMLGLGSGFTQPSPYVDGNLKQIQSATATDKYTVVLKLKQAFPVIIEYLIPGGNNFMVVPREAVEAYGNLEDWRHAVGTGPWILTDYVRGSSITYIRNPNYWGTDELHPANKIPYADGVQLLIVPDQATALAALRTGKLDLYGGPLSGLTWDTAKSIQQTNPELKWKEFYDYAYTFDFRNDLPPFTDIRVRRALQMAINLQEIADTYYGGKADPLPSFVSRSMTGVWAPLEEYPKEAQEAFTYNPEKAKQLLAEAGYANGFETSVLVTPQRYGTVDLAELTKAYWQKINVTLDINSMDYTACTAARYAGAFTGLCFFVTAESSSPWSGFALREPGMPYNFAHVSDPVWKKMIDDAKSNPDPAERMGLAKQANIYGTSQHFYVGFPVPYVYSFWQPWVKGYNGEPGLSGVSPIYGISAVLARIWIDTDLKSKLVGQ